VKHALRLALVLLPFAACEAGKILSPVTPLAPTQLPSTPPSEVPPVVVMPKPASECVPVVTTKPLPLRRLTQVEYANSIRDLLKVTQVSRTGLPADEKTGLFLSNTSTLMSWSMLEQYGNLAESLAKSVEGNLSSLLPCDPVSVGDEACAHAFIDEFGFKVYRRPLTTDERDRYRAFYATHAGRGGFTHGVRFVVQGMLHSPNFLYHVERMAPLGSATEVPVAPYELASRLSFFLWNSTPDLALLDAVRDGKLTSDEDLAAQTERMLLDAKAKGAIGAFHAQLLGIDAANVPNKNPALYPAFNATLWAAMVSETSDFSDYVVRQGDGKLATLLSAPYSLLEGPLFAHYGVAEPSGHDATQPVDLNPARHAGILTHASVMAALANPDTTSPVRRGVMIRRNLMCSQLPDPPPDVPTMVPPPMPGETTRQRVTRITSQKTICGTCHGFINDVGFGFEHYDPVGQWRDLDNGLTVDASGKLTGTLASDGAFDGARELSSALATSSEVQSCYAGQWVRFGLGRPEQPRDGCEIELLAENFRKSDGDIRALVKAIVLSKTFRLAYVEGAP
jgi:hypothetical protein